MANRDCEVCKTYPCSCVDVDELQAEIERLRAALVNLVGTSGAPWYRDYKGDLHCVYCAAYVKIPGTEGHEVDCPWLVAKTLLSPE